MGIFLGFAIAMGILGVTKQMTLYFPPRSVRNGCTSTQHLLTLSNSTS